MARQLHHGLLRSAAAASNLPLLGPMVTAMTSDSLPPGNLLPPHPSCSDPAATLLLVQGPEVDLEPGRSR
jgi:hypothetical protein